MSDDLLKELELEGVTSGTEDDIVGWVVSNTQKWRNHIESNYVERWDEYYRIWRGIWSTEDTERKSERSQLISPASQQAVESSCAEIEEATFGRGSFFDVKDDMDDQETQDIGYLKNKLAQEFEKHKIRRDTNECVLNAAVFGTGLAEIVLEEYTDYKPAVKDVGGIQEGGRIEQPKVCFKLRPIKPHNFRIPESATCIEDAIGVGIEEFVSKDYVYDMIEEGVYMDPEAPIATVGSDEILEANPELDVQPQDRVRLLRYYGKVPRSMLEEVEGYEDNQNSEGDSYYVEAIVVIANDGVLLKAEPNPYLMNDRPIVAFQWDTVPGLFWGRGVVEKGYVDTERMYVTGGASVETQWR